MAARATARPLLAWPWKLAAKANRAQAADFGNVGLSSTVSPHHKDYATYLRAYKTVPYVRSGVSVIPCSAANVKYALVKAGKSNEDGTEDVRTRSPLLERLERPNPY